MWQPIDLKFVNFLSYEEAHYIYKNDKLDIIQGVNLDDDESKSGEESNGSGKSSLIEAEGFIYLGEPLRDVRAVDLIRNGEKMSEITHNLFNPVLKKGLKIVRTIHEKKSSELFFWYRDAESKEDVLNGVWTDQDQVKFPSVTDGGKLLLEKYIGINKEDIMNYYIISKKKYSSFYYSPDGKKKDIISRFSGAFLMFGVEDIVKEDVKSEKVVLKKKEEEKISIESSIKVYEKEIEEYESKDFQKEKDEQIGKVKEKQKALKILNEILQTNFENNKAKVVGFITSLKAKEKEISLKIDSKPKTTTSDIETKEKEVLKAKGEIILQKDQVGEDLKEYENFISELDKTIMGSVVCPKCSHEFNIGNKEINIEEARKQLPEIKSEVEVLNESLGKFDEKIKIFNTTLREYDILKENQRKEENKYKIELHALEQDKAAIQRSMLILDSNNKNIEEDIFSNNKEIIRLDGEIQKIKDRVEENKTAGYKKKIKELEEDLKSKLLEISEKEKEINSKEIWVDYFVKFKTFLANKSIKSIEGFTNLYLQKAKTNLAILMEGYGVLADGKTVREKITTTVLRDGIIEGLLGKFSEGEKAKIEISTILALQQLINLNSPTGGLNLLSIDEILESVSKKGMVDVIEFLKGIEQTIKLITHVNFDKNINCDILTCLKQNKTTKFVINYGKN